MPDARGTILIVDDDLDTVEMLAEYLGGRRLNVARAETLDEALGELAKARPEAVLLNVRLGEADGLEALKRIREVNVQVGVLAMAEQADEERAKDALQLGAADYLLKPIDFDLLSRAIDKVLAAAAPTLDFAEAAPVASPATSQNLLYTLALEVFRATRPLTPEARASVGTALEQAALQAMNRAVGGEKAEVIRALNQVRNLIRFAHDLDDISAETAERLEEHMAKVRRTLGLT